MTNDDITRSRDTDDLRKLWWEINGPSPRCRECADHDGRCVTGEPCDPQERALENLRKLRDRIQQLEPENARLRAAATALYHAAHWTSDRPCDAVRLWTELRDAIGLPHGTAPKPKGQSDEND